MSDKPETHQDDHQHDDEPVIEKHAWLGKLSAENPILKFEGCDDAHVCDCDGCSDGQLHLKRATLDVNCEDESRHVIEVKTFDHDEKQIEGTLCSLDLKFFHTSDLTDLIVSPPTQFRLVKGKGPITIIGNLHKEAEDHGHGDEEGGENENDIEEIMNEVAMARAKRAMERAKAEGRDVNEIVAEELKDSLPAEDDDEPAAKKPKIGVEASVTSASSSNSKSKNSSSNKESDSGNSSDNEIDSAQSLIKSIQADSGYSKLCNYYKFGKQAKRNQFVNWVKKQFSCENEEWVEQAWKMISKNK